MDKGAGLLFLNSQQGYREIECIEAAIFGNELHYGYDAFTAEVTNLFSKVLNIRPDHIYIKYEDIIAWGVQGTYIDRNQYR